MSGSNVCEDRDCIFSNFYFVIVFTTIVTSFRFIKLLCTGQQGSGTALEFCAKDARMGHQLPDFINFAEKSLPRDFISPRLESLGNNRVECRLQGLLSADVAKVWQRRVDVA